MSHPSNKITVENVELMFAHLRPDQMKVADMETVRQHAVYLAKVILAVVPDCADRSAALRAVRESAMWSNSAIVKAPNHVE